MITTHEYKVITSSPQPGHKLINEKAIKEGHTADMDIYASDGFDAVWNDQQGNEVTSGYRLTADRKSRVLITIVNSYKKDLKDQQTKNLTINND